MMNEIPTPEELVKKIKNPEISGKLVLEIEPDELGDEPRKITLYDFNTISQYWRECDYSTQTILAYHDSIQNFISSTLFDLSMTHCVYGVTIDADLGEVTRMYLRKSETTNIDDSVIDAVCYNIRCLDEIPTDGGAQ